MARKTFPPGEYSVGYRKPPRDSRFKPGHSGNPSGRPPGAKNKPAQLGDLTSIMLTEARRLVPTNQDGKIVHISTAEALLRVLSKKAFAGSHPAQRTLLTLFLGAEMQAKRDWRVSLESAISYKVEGMARLAEAAEHGVTLDLVPDPRVMHITDDSIIVDGPNTSEEKETWDALRAELDTVQRKLRSHRRRSGAEALEILRQLEDQERRLLNALASIRSEFLPAGG